MHFDKTMHDAFRLFLSEKRIFVITNKVRTAFSVGGRFFKEDQYFYL